MYHNIVFDIGGVVVDYSPTNFLVDHFFSERSEAKLYEAVFGSEEWVELDKGKLSWPEATRIFKARGKEMDLAFEMQALLDEWTDMLTTKKATVSLLRILKKKGLRLYYLSNISHYALELLQKRDFWPLFDGGLASCNAGLCKPEPDFFRKFIQHEKLVPQETIFTDDRKENTAAAFEVGITGIQFRNVKNFCKMLVTYGIDVF